MMNKNHDFSIMITSVLEELLERFGNLLDDESINSVRHYLDHREFEMAFEGLFIELIKIDTVFSKNELINCIHLAQKLGLDNESVFDGEFWESLNRFSDSKN